MKYTINYIALLCFLLLAGTGCAHDHSAPNHDHGTEGHSHEDDGHAHGAEASSPEDEHEHDDAEHSEGEVRLSAEQIAAMDIQLDGFTPLKINDFIRATGVLDLPPNAVYSVSARANGFLRNSRKLVVGSPIRQGTIVAYLENAELIGVQREYLEVRARLTYDEQELARQRTLVAAEAGVEKRVQQLEAAVAGTRATLAGLQRQLRYLDIDPEELSATNLIERIPIRTRMGGYLTKVALHDGMYVTPEQELLEVVDAEHLHLELNVFEKDIAQVRPGQALSYTVPALGPERFEGEITVVGREFDLESKTVRVHAHPEGKQPHFVRNLFVEATIYLTDETVPALPDAAVLRSGEMERIYIVQESDADGTTFVPVRVTTRASREGYVAVIPVDPLPPDARIVTKGSFFVDAQARSGELSHEH